MRALAGLLWIALVLAPPAWPADRDDLVEAWLAAWNGAPERLAGRLAEDFIDTTALLPGDAAALHRQIAAWRAAIPDLHVTLLERASAKEREVLRVRLEGQPSDPEALVPVTGGALAIERIDWLTVKGDRIAALRAMIDEWTLPPELQFIPPPIEPRAPMPAHTVATFPPGTFLESLATGPDGRLFVSTGPEGGIVAVDPRTGAIAPFARVPVGPGGLMMCLTFGSAGELYASVLSRDASFHGVWRFAPDGSGMRIAALPLDALPNGIALDGRGALLVADSFGGLIWRVTLADGEVQPWLRDARLAQRPLVGAFPGANGLQASADSAFVAVSDRSTILRIPIEDDGRAGEPAIVSGMVAGDDFAIAPDGTLYVTTHPFNSIVRLAPRGKTVVIAGPQQGVVGPTSATIGADGALYVATDGGLYRMRPGLPLNPAIVRIELKPR